MSPVITYEERSIEVYAPDFDVAVHPSANHGAEIVSGSASSRRLLRYRDGSGSLSLSVRPLKETSEAWQWSIDVPTKRSRTLRSRGWIRLRVDPPELRGGIGAWRVTTPDGDRIVILSLRDGRDFMADIPDLTPLGDLTLPGTHESCAMYGYPVAQCQQPSTPIAQQLRDGIRYFDVRLRVVDDQLLMYHGPASQRSTLPILLQAFHDFLQSSPTETFLLCLKEESPPNHPHFASLVYRDFRSYLSEWYLENRVPCLGEVRGKGILITRFDNNKPGGEKDWPYGIGIHPYTWPDSRPEGFEWDCAGTRFRIQDYYRVKTFLEIPEKFQAVVDHLIPTLQPTEGAPFSLSYTSASYFPLSPPSVIAKGVGWPTWGMGVYGMNDRLMGWLLTQMSEGKRVRGCLPMDFYRQSSIQGDLAAMLVSMNFM